LVSKYRSLTLVTKKKLVTKFAPLIINLDTNLEINFLVDNVSDN